MMSSVLLVNSKTTTILPDSVVDLVKLNDLNHLHTSEGY